MKQCMFLILCLTLGCVAYAQDNDKREKVVTVDVSKEGDMDRKIKIVLDDSGKEQIIEWSDNGKIPDDIKKQLEAAGVDVKMLESHGESGKEGEKMIEVIVETEEDGDGDEDNIWIEKDGDEVYRIRKKVVKDEAYKMVIVDDDGNEKVFEWDGEGEMPDEMKEMMREHDMEIHEGHEKGRKMRMRKNMKEKGVHKERGEMRFGKGHQRMMKGENVFIIEDDDMTKPMSDTYMGAQIGSERDEDFVVVQEIIKDGPADKGGLEKGDQIHRINGARTKSVDDMMTLLGMFEPNDQVELTISRDGKERKTKVTLAKRPDYYK